MGWRPTTLLVMVRRYRCTSCGHVWRQDTTVDEHCFDGVTAIGVDEHVWRHTRRGDKYVTVIVDLTGIREGTGPARLLDMVEGRSKQAFKASPGSRRPPQKSCPTPLR
jgi:transposase